MKRVARFICACGFLFAALALVQVGRVTLVAQSPTARAMALTFDDLPYVALESSDYVHDADRVTTEILRVLRTHNAPAVAFVNEARLQVQGETDARVAVLKRWADSGIVLGNHTYSHADLNALTADQYEDEIIRGEVVTRRLMEPRNPYQLYFRHPFTHTGDTAEKKRAVEGFLAARGYKVAPFTIENSDFIFARPYAKARRSGDDTMKQRLSQAYLDFTVSETTFMETIATQLFGHDIPQTLLVHSNDITADNLDKMLTTFERRGYRFITLAQAMADTAYRTQDVVTKAGPTWLWRWMKSKGMNLNFRDEPDPPAWVTDLDTKH
jgi:peptidoglycan/xylan/chitin deacetylase (PgdA/CDA1 family)